MNTADLKLKLFRALDNLDQKTLEELYGIILNHVNSKDDVDEWNNLTSTQQEGLKKSLKQLDNNEGIPHNQVM
ncbi:MAG: hypothetical protein ACLFUH_10315, partial [Bacteroidales bacterium]